MVKTIHYEELIPAVRDMIVRVKGGGQRRANRWLQYETMEAYIRVGERMMPDRESVLCIQIANVTTPHQRQGMFTRMVKELEQFNLPIFLECVINQEWRDSLLARHGWQIAFDRGEDPSDLIKGYKS